VLVSAGFIEKITKTGIYYYKVMRRINKAAQKL